MTQSSSRVPDARLLRLARAEQHRAKVLRTRRWIAHGVTLALGLLGILVPGDTSYVTTMLAVCTEGAAWMFRQRSRAVHQRAEQGKRIAELRRFYDPRAAMGAETDFRRAVSSWACQHANEDDFDDTAYWDASPGTGREPLRRAVREAAWWSWSLYDEGARLARAFAVGTILLALLLMVLFLFVGLAAAAEEVARVSLLVIAGLIGADALSLWTDWSTASSDAETAYRSLTPPAGSDADLFALYVDYRVLTAGTEPIPHWIYKRHQDRLNTSWRAENQVA